MIIQDYLGKSIKIQIDCPLGSKHPIDADIDHPANCIYPVNYGHALGYKAYLLGIFDPVTEYEGRLIGILTRERNAEPILIVSPHLYTSGQINALVEFQEKWCAHDSLLVYDKTYWPEDFSFDMPIVQQAIKILRKDTTYSSSSLALALSKGHGYTSRLLSWLKDNGVIES